MTEPRGCRRVHAPAGPRRALAGTDKHGVAEPRRCGDTNEAAKWIERGLIEDLDGQ